MPQIHILPKSVYQLIAAGEVVERPASAIKEMVENSIDAGATRITVEIQHGGSTYMRITDDGCGIARADVPKVFISHATSKIATEEDLNAIAPWAFGARPWLPSAQWRRWNCLPAQQRSRWAPAM